MIHKIYYDLETNGCKNVSLYNKNHKIIQIAAVNEKNEKFNDYVNPHVPIPRQSTDIHNITGIDIEKANSFEKVSERFISFIFRHVNEGDIIILIAHNNYQFDMKMILKEFDAINIDFLQKFRNVQFYCSLEMFRLTHVHIKSKSSLKTPYSLINLYRYFYPQEPLFKAHDALADVLALKRICQDFLNITIDKCIPGISLCINLESPITSIKYIGPWRGRKMKKKLTSMKNHDFSWSGDPVWAKKENDVYVKDVLDMITYFAPDKYSENHNRHQQIEHFLRYHIGIHDDTQLIYLIATLSNTEEHDIYKLFPFISDTYGVLNDIINEIPLEYKNDCKTLSSIISYIIIFCDSNINIFCDKMSIDLNLQTFEYLNKCLK